MERWGGVRRLVEAAASTGRCVRPFVVEHDLLGTAAFASARAGLPRSLLIPAAVRIAEARGAAARQG